MFVIVALVVASVAIWQGTAKAAAPHGTTPHNENGNTYLDVYWTANFSGDQGDVVDSYYEPANGLGDAPLLRRVLDLNAADIHLYKTPCTDDGNSESFFRHNEAAVDEVSIGDCVTSQVYVLEHEQLHGESMGHHDELCDALLVDETVGIKSFMCPKRTDIAKLPQHDKVDLRSIPNKREGFEAMGIARAEAGDEPGGDYTIYETFPTKIPAWKAD